jgi:ubiquinone/menaquinone biosynthesis C-methylase UbiE
MKINLNEILAYKELKKGKNLNKKITFSKLTTISKKCREPLFDDIKVYMILTIKWHFDYLAKTRKNPKELNESLKFWYRVFYIFYEFKKLGWITGKSKKKLNRDVWKSTRRAFNFMWPKNTENKKYNASKHMVDLRIKQIINNISKNKFYFKNKIILDSGCGPGRYMESLLKYKPKEIIGIDSGSDIIKSNKIRFKNKKKLKFINSKFDKLKFKDEVFDLIISAGVLHHTKTSLSSMIKDHSRVLKKNGHFFVFIVGKGGQELDLWKFCRRVLIDVDIQKVFNKLVGVISPLRLQGLLDHAYGEYKTTSRVLFENILKKNFSRVKKIEGIIGADVTKNTFSNDKYFKIRFGTGNLRYLCVK